ncbi:MAG: head-tail connector protein [Parabacteroides sp.]|nr:head-tail connector protein [Parabacteroides sp.]
MPTLEEVKDYLCIDFDDEATNRTLNRLILTADAYLKGAIGENYPTDNHKAKQIALLLISDLYDNRDLTEKVSANMRKIVDDFSLQLRLELSRGLYLPADTIDTGGEVVI